jgi:hypothetical protein
MDPNATWQMLCDYLRALHQDPHRFPVVMEKFWALRGECSNGSFHHPSRSSLATISSPPRGVQLT